MKLTVMDVYKKLEEFIAKNPDVHGDMLVTNVSSFSTVGYQNNVNPENRLRYLRFFVTSSDEIMSGIIEF